MSSGLDSKDLVDLARHLLKDGPVKTYSAAPRRIRVVFNGKYIADSRQATYIWEHPYYPQLYIPRTDIIAPDAMRVIDEVDVGGMTAEVWSMKIDSKELRRVVLFASHNKNDLAGLARIEFKAADAWFEEDEPILVHPKDPFKRVDVLPSSARIRVSIDGQILADAEFAMHLYETGLPVRYYLPQTSIDQSLLRPSAQDTHTDCPYKGTASYFDVVLPDGKVYPDLVWYYTSPNLECAGIKGMACFYNEKVDISIDGITEEKPRTHFA